MKNARAAVPQMSIEKNPRKPKLARVLSRLIAAGIDDETVTSSRISAATRDAAGFRNREQGAQLFDVQPQLHFSTASAELSSFLVMPKADRSEEFRYWTRTVIRFYYCSRLLPMRTSIS
jgi:hypothetical protein